MSASSPQSAASKPGPSSPPSSSVAALASNEDDLRSQLRASLQSLSRQEPLDPNYKRLLSSSVLTRRTAVIPKDKFYRRLGSRLRERVVTYFGEMQGKDPFDRISQRQPLEEAAMRAAFTLREAKEHEQQALLEATLAAKEMDPVQKRHLDGIALGLQSRKEAKKMRSMTPVPSVMEQTEHARQKADLDRQRAQARKREEARNRRDEEERRRKEDELNHKKNLAETPQHALHKVIEPVFKRLWDMQFVNLGHTNPFRIVIDRETCASLGAPDYFDYIDTPMNLAYIQEKVNTMNYTSLHAFFADVELMINNAILYNSDPSNPYRIAAEEMNKRHSKIVKKVLQQIQAKQS
jgi:hypothetical protein